MFRTLFVSIACLFTSMAFAAEPVFLENFDKLDNERWALGLAGLDSCIRINEFAGLNELELMNGASLKTIQSFGSALDIQISWAYESDNSDADRPEVLTLAIRSDGKFKDGVLQNGVAAQFHTVSGAVSLVEFVDGKPLVLKKKVVNAMPDGSAGIPRGDGHNWFRIRVRDDGETLSVISPELNDLALEAPYQLAKHPQNRIVIFNQSRPAMDANRSFFRCMLVTSNK